MNQYLKAAVWIIAILILALVIAPMLVGAFMFAEFFHLPANVVGHH